MLCTICNDKIIELENREVVSKSEGRVREEGGVTTNDGAQGSSFLMVVSEIHTCDKMPLN